MSSDITHIYLVRHGESELNLAGKIGGQSDPPLTEKGKEQAKEARVKLEGTHFADVYSSDLQRAVATAAIIAGRPVPKSHQLAGLRERTFGDLDGLHDKHLKGWHAALMALPPADRWHYRHISGMETDAELMGRFTRSLEKIARKHPGEAILVAAHGGCIRALLVKLGFAKHEDVPPKAFKNAGYVKLAFKGGQLKVEEVAGIDQQVVEQHK